jgi:carboxylate-amine ligase
MVLKTRDGYGGLGVYIMPDLTATQRDAAKRALKATPEAFIAQEMLDFSRHLVFSDDELDFDERFIDLRVYAVQDALGNVTVFPGGLTRVARQGTRITNNSSGGACKETWVIC